MAVVAIGAWGSRDLMPDDPVELLFIHEVSGSVLVPPADWHAASYHSAPHGRRMGTYAMSRRRRSFGTLLAHL